MRTGSPRLATGFPVRSHMDADMEVERDRWITDVASITASRFVSFLGQTSAEVVDSARATNEGVGWALEGPHRFENVTLAAEELAEAIEQARRMMGHVPMMADVWQMMDREGVSQDEAVRRLGGQPAVGGAGSS